MSLDFANMDPTDHTHIPYIPILVRALQDWKNMVSMSSPIDTFTDTAQARW